MKFKTLMIIKSAVCLVLGLPILLIPALFYSLFGVTLGAGGEITAREYGASMMGNLVLTWFARNATSSDARRAIILDLFLYDLVGFVVILIAQLSGLLNPLGWLAVLLYLFLAIGFGYFLIKPPQP
jgi:hypothetical protein